MPRGVPRGEHIHPNAPAGWGRGERRSAMTITRIRLCGVGDIPGFDYSRPRLSWVADGGESRSVTSCTVEIATDPAFLEIVYRRSGQLNPLGEELDYKPAPRTEYHLRITVVFDDAATLTSAPFHFETGKMQEKWVAEWIAPQAGDDCHPCFFREVVIDRPVCRARLYATAAGVFEAAVDGVKLGDEFLAPFCNDYRFSRQVVTFPLDLPVGRHRITLTVGGGWYAGRFGLDGRRANWGDTVAAVGEIHITYADGTHCVIPTDRSWRYHPSDILFSGIYDGEDVDRPSHAADVPQHPVRILPNGKSRDRRRLTDRTSPPLRVNLTLPVRKVIRTPAGETVLDFGQNCAGFVAFRNRLPAGRTVTLDYGEVLQGGNFYRDNLRTARAQFVYRSAGRVETVRPHFTYFGFRYVRLSGWDDPDPRDFTACCLWSQMTPAARIRTGNARANRLLANTLWGLRSNFVDIPTDCPQRDERLGWTGDAQVFAGTASFWYDTRAFYEKYLGELRRVQRTLAGGIPHYVPAPGTPPGCCSVWGDAATLIPETLWRQYGDRAALADHYPMMRDWVNYIRRIDRQSGGHFLWDTGFHFGDWLALDGVTEQSMRGSTDEGYIASVYYFRSAAIVGEAAEILGYTRDAARYAALAARIRTAVLRRYFTPDGILAVPSQTGCLLALRFGIWRDRDRLIAQTRERFRRDRFRLRCGFVGAPLLCSTLAAAGMPRLAYRLFFRRDFPSWLRCVDQGATTIWERWNSLLPDGTVSGTGMNSLNHYAFGAVAEFLFSCAAGLTPLSPGFTRAKIAPLPDRRLGRLDLRYRSAAGDYAVRWIIRGDGTFALSVTVPSGCTAEIWLPGTEGQVKAVGAGIHRFRYRPTEDFCRVCFPDTPLDEIGEMSRAVEILRRYTPAFAGMAESGGPETGSITLSDLSGMTYIPHDPDALRAALTELYALRSPPETDGFPPGIPTAKPLPPGKRRVSNQTRRKPHAVLPRHSV